MIGSLGGQTGEVAGVVASERVRQSRLLGSLSPRIKAHWPAVTLGRGVGGGHSEQSGGTLGGGEIVGHAHSSS